VGFSDLNIAAQLDISEGTVGWHLNRIYKKLKVHSRVELSKLLAAGGR
jgi:DNA-binding CsgD family transcriptional regulator